MVKRYSVKHLSETVRNALSVSLCQILIGKVGGCYGKELFIVSVVDNLRYRLYFVSVGFNGWAFHPQVINAEHRALFKSLKLLRLVYNYLFQFQRRDHNQFASFAFVL